MHQAVPARLRSIVAFLLVISVSTAALGRRHDDTNESENLAGIQARVVKVVAQNMEACVAISDGEGFGSGAIVSADGLILTAGHVVCNVKQTFDL